MIVKELIDTLKLIDPNKEVKLRFGTYEDFGADGLDKVYSEYSITSDDVYIFNDNLYIEPET